MKKPKYQFAGRSHDGTRYIWLPAGNTLAPQITVGIDYFWKTAKYGGHEACS